MKGIIMSKKTFDFNALSGQQWHLVDVLTNIVKYNCKTDQGINEFILNSLKDENINGKYSFRIYYDTGLKAMSLLDDFINESIAKESDFTKRELLFYMQKDFNLINDDHNAISCLGNNLYEDYISMNESDTVILNQA